MPCLLQHGEVVRGRWTVVLPAGGTPGTLTTDLVDPLTSTAGVFAGQLTAAKLDTRRQRQALLTL
ncbi:MAG: hypothetical protein AB1486_14000 [Planctomycetota bacterium]